MQQHVDFVTVSVADLDGVRRFYVDGLGWRPLLDVPGEIVFFQVGHGMVLGLFDADHFVADLQADPATPLVPSGFTLSHNVGSPAEVDGVVADAERAGAVVLKRPQRGDFGGYHGHFADPAGVVWEIAYNSGWRVADDGTVSLRPVTD